MHSSLAIAVVLLGSAHLAHAQVAPQGPHDAHKHCTLCEDWNRPEPPFKVFGGTYYVGTAGLSAVLIAGAKGHVLLDGALPQSARVIEDNIRKLGFDPRDVRLILNSHAHYDHAGGIAALQEFSKGQVAASARGAQALERGEPTPDDPQFAFGPDVNAYPRIKNVRVVADRETLHLGDVAVTAHLTPGHTPGGTTWSWRSCEQSRCIDVVYADSLNAVSAPAYRFSDFPAELEAFRASMKRVEGMPCDVLIPVHPGASDLFERREAAGESSSAFIDSSACEKYAKAAAVALERRIAKEMRAP